MNIPEMTIDMKQELHSESVVSAQAVRKTDSQGDALQSAETGGTRSETDGNKQTANTKEELKAMIEEAENHLEANDVKLKFNVLEDNDTIQVEVLDSDGKVIRKIPEDDLIKLTKSLKNLGQGFLDERY